MNTCKNQSQQPHQTVTPNSLIDETPKTVLLDKIADSQKSTLVNAFLRPIRQGVRNPPVIVQSVRHDLKDRIERACSPESAQRLQLLLGTVQAFPDEAQELAAHYVAYEALPDEQRQVVKEAQQQRGINRWMEKQPATDAQRQYLRVLGFDGEEPQNKFQASQLIQLMREKNQGRRQNVNA